MRKTGWLAGLFLVLFLMVPAPVKAEKELCLLYTSDAADEL